MKIKIDAKNFFKLFFTILLITKISSNETKLSPEEFINNNDTNEKGIMTKERYELLKANASFDVMPYEKFLKIFGEVDLNKKAGEITHKQELTFLAENKIEEISHNEETENEKSFGRNLQVLPVNYDSRDKYPDCFKNIVRDQMNCGGCW